MVRAADGGGAAPGPWASIDFTFAPLEPSAPSPRAKEASSPTATPTPTPGAAEADAELELQGGSEDFKVSPEAQAIDIASASAGVSPPAAAAAAQAPTPTPVTAEGAAALLKAGRNDDAEAAYRALLDANPRNSDDWEGLGDSYRARMMKVEAADCYKKALKYDATKTRLKDWLDANVRN
jgi:tetratricopeptide (TPR) repeat protein